MRDPNLSQLIAAADALRPLLGELVSVGGCVTGILITDGAAAEPRGTLYVDAIAEITSYVQYAEFGERLRFGVRTRQQRRRASLSLDSGSDDPRCNATERGDSGLF